MKFLPKSKIMIKGLAFIIVPCLINALFSTQLMYLISAAEKAALQEHKHMEIVKHANSLMSVYASLSGQYGTYAMTSDPTALKNAETYEKILDSEFDKLIPLLVDQPEMQKNTTMYRDRGKEMLQKFRKLGSTRPSNGEDISGTIEFFKQSGMRDFIWKAGNTSKDITNLAFQQEEKLEALRQSQQKTRHEITDSLLKLIGFNLLTALIMGALFLYDISRRLNLLMRNAQLLPKLVPLEEKVGGEDELSYLDEILHEAATELRSSNDQRRYLMEMVAHDIRSPLMSSQVSLEVLSDKRIGELPPMALRQVEALGTNIRRVIALTSDLMEIDKLEMENLDLNKELLDIQALVEENLVGLAELAKKKNITLVNECQPIAVMADRLRLGQVVTNIVSNAIKFSPNNERIRVTATRNEAYLNLSVIDYGPGIPKKHQQRVFEKYAQLENGRGKGFGLGLAICKLIVTAHEGAIGATNEADAGAKFWVRLPLPKRKEYRETD